MHIFNNLDIVFILCKNCLIIGLNSNKNSLTTILRHFIRWKLTRSRCLFSPRWIRWETMNYSEKSSTKVISSRRIKLIRPAVVSQVYFKYHQCCRTVSSRSCSWNVCRRNFSSIPFRVSHVVDIALWGEQKIYIYLKRKGGRASARLRRQNTKRMRNGGCDVRRNPGTQSRWRVAAGICQVVHTCVRLSTRNKNYTWHRRDWKRAGARSKSLVSPHVFSYIFVL